MGYPDLLAASFTKIKTAQNANAAPSTVSGANHAALSKPAKISAKIHGLTDAEGVKMDLQT